MKKPLKLVDFAITKINLEWFENEKDINEKIDPVPTIDYRVLRNPDHERDFSLILNVMTYSDKYPGGSVYSIDSEIAGIFTFTDDATEEEMQYLIRVNGATILYGLLRGEIATVTGAFPEGKYVLPAVYMQEVLPEIDKRKASAARKKAISKRRVVKREKVSPKTPIVKKKTTVSKKKVTHKKRKA